MEGVKDDPDAAATVYDNAQDSTETYARGGGALRAHGDEYHLLIVMAIMVHAYVQNLDFEVAIEYDPAGKFDDIYFRFKNKNGEWQDIYFQIKHTVKESAEIKITDLVPPPPKGTKKVNCKYNILDFLDSFVKIKKNRARPCSCLLFTNQKWLCDEITTYFQFTEVNTEDIDKFLLQVMKPTLLKLGENRNDTSWYTRVKSEINVDDLNDFIQSFFIAHEQHSLDDIKSNLQKLMFEVANQNSTLGLIMFDNLYGQLQKWFNSSIGTFKNKGFVHNFIHSFVNNAKFFYRHHVRDPNKHFVGREEQLKSITSIQELKDIGEFVDVAVVGMSGFGKTQFILKYLHEQESKFTHIFWINAENNTTIFHTFIQIAKKFNISYNSASSSEEDLIHDIYTCFNDRQKVAFVFDNAIDIDDLVTYLPSTSQNYIKIFVTSNNIDWPAQITIKIDTFHENESLELATKILGDNIFEKATLQDLAEKLGHFPLALHLACSYIGRMTRAEDCGNPQECISQFLQDYNKEPTIFQNLNPSFKDYNSYKQSLFKIWLIQKQKLLQNREHGELCVVIMKLLSLCESDNIPLSFLEQGVENTKEEISASLSVLQTYSLIDIKDDKIFIHSLVQDIIKQEMKQDAEIHKYLEIALQSCNKLKTSDKDKEYFFQSDFLNHALKIWNTLVAINITDLILKFGTFPEIIIRTLNMHYLFRQAIEYSDEVIPILKLHFDEKSEEIVKASYFRAQAKNIGGQYKKALEELQQMKIILSEHNETDTSHEVGVHPFLWAVLLEMAHSLTQIGKQNEALEIYDQVLNERRKQLGDNHHLSLLCRHNRVTVLQNLGEYEEALQEYDSLLAVETETLGENHAGTITTQSNRALVLEALGRYEEALNIYNNLLEVEKNKFGPNHPNTLCTMNNYAMILDLMGQYDEALHAYNKILELKYEIFGEEHPQTLTTMINKASVLDSMGSFHESLGIYDKVIKTRQDKLGSEHHETLTAMNNRALVLQQLGQLDESLGVLEYVISVQEKNLGPDHPRTLKTLSNKATLLTNVGRFPEALILYDKINENNIKKLGIDHPETLTLLQSKSSLLNKMGKYEESFQILVEVLNIRKDKLGYDHPSTLLSMSSKALTLQHMGKYNEALQEYDTLLELLRQKLGEKHPNTVATLANKAILLRLMGKYQEALTSYDHLLVIRQEQLGSDHPSTLAAMNNKALVLQNMKQFNEALDVYNKIIPLQNEKLGSDHPSSLSTLHNRASILQQLGRLEEALSEIEKLLQTEKCKLGEDHPSTLTSMFGKAHVLQNLERFEESLEIYNHVLSLQKIKLGENHPSVLSTTHNKATLLCSMGNYVEARQLFEQVLEKKTRVLGAQHPSTLNTLKYLQP